MKKKLNNILEFLSDMRVKYPMAAKTMETFVEKKRPLFPIHFAEYLAEANSSQGFTYFASLPSAFFL